MTSTSTCPMVALLKWPSMATMTGFRCVPLHGSPTSNAYWVMVDEPARMKWVRVQAPNRPGLGGSDPHSLPSLASYAEDVAAIADRLGFDSIRSNRPFRWRAVRFGLRCCSPGTTHSRCHSRWWRALDAPGVQDKLGASDRRILSLLQRGKEAPARRRFKLMGPAARYLPWLVLSAMKGSVSSSEREAFDRWGRSIVDSIAEAFDQGPEAAVNEYRLFSKAENWGFEPRDISAPVSIWQGEEDRATDTLHAQTLATMMPRART